MQIKASAERNISCLTYANIYTQSSMCSEGYAPYLDKATFLCAVQAIIANIFLSRSVGDKQRTGTHF